MYTLLIIGLGVAVFIKMFCRVRTNVNLLKDRMLEKAQSSIRNARQELTQSAGFSASKPSLALKNFSQRSAFIFQTYCEQMYLGVENTPMEKYAALHLEMDADLRKV